MNQDYAGGHIKGALNVESQKFNDQSIVDEVRLISCIREHTSCSLQVV